MKFCGNKRKFHSFRKKTWSWMFNWWIEFWPGKYYYTAIPVWQTDSKRMNYLYCLQMTKTFLSILVLRNVLRPHSKFLFPFRFCHSILMKLSFFFYCAKYVERKSYILPAISWLCPLLKFRSRLKGFSKLNLIHGWFLDPWLWFMNSV